MLDIGYPSLGRADVFLMEGERIESQVPLDDHAERADKAWPARSHVTALDLLPGAQRTLLFRVQTVGTMLVPAAPARAWPRSSRLPAQWPGSRRASLRPGGWLAARYRALAWRWGRCRWFWCGPLGLPRSGLVARFGHQRVGRDDDAAGWFGGRYDRWLVTSAPVDSGA
jgi:hypothetical protein